MRVGDLAGGALSVIPPAILLAAVDAVSGLVIGRLMLALFAGATVVFWALALRRDMSAIAAGEHATRRRFRAMLAGRCAFGDGGRFWSDIGLAAMWLTVGVMERFYAPRHEAMAVGFLALGGGTAVGVIARCYVFRPRAERALAALGPPSADDLRATAVEVLGAKGRVEAMEFLRQQAGASLFDAVTAVDSIDATHENP